MSTWLACIVLGVFTVAFVPSLLAGMVKVLSGVGKKYPVLSDIAATLALILTSCALILQVILFSAVYHHLLTGSP